MDIKLEYVANAGKYLRIFSMGFELYCEIFARYELYCIVNPFSTLDNNKELIQDDKSFV